MTIRYANDVLLTELARRIHNEEKSMQQYLTDGNLDGAFLRAHVLLGGSKPGLLQQFMERLNEIKYDPAFHR